jgi:RNA polymerase sigma-70 factor (ECF subfamily)
MLEENFAGFLARVRAGDEQATTELVQRYGSMIRREARVRLTESSVCRVVDAEDICQSVLASFFIRASFGQYDLSDPAQLRRLLLSIARDKLARAARYHQAQTRGDGASAAATVEGLGLAGTSASPSRVVAGRELLAQVHGRLTDEERQVVELRGQGYDWAEIAGRLGGSPEGWRRQLTQALDRVSRELGLEDSDG